MKSRRIFSMVLALGAALPLLAQQADWQPRANGLGLGSAHASQDWVSLDSPNLTLVAGKAQSVTVKFEIQEGLHVNSHTPLSPYLIPTTLTLNAPKGLHLSDITYPQATEYHFKFAPKDTLLVYTGPLPITMQAKAKAGTYTVPGKLKYQACDHQTCNPPKTLLFTLHVTAK